MQEQHLQKQTTPQQTHNLVSWMVNLQYQNLVSAPPKSTTDYSKNLFFQ